MKAITFQGVRNVEVQNVEEPILVNADDVIVKVLLYPKSFIKLIPQIPRELFD